MQKIEWTPKERYGEGFRSSFESHYLGVTLDYSRKYATKCLLDIFINFYDYVNN